MLCGQSSSGRLLSRQSLGRNIRPGQQLLECLSGTGGVALGLGDGHETSFKGLVFVSDKEAFLPRIVSILD